MRFPFCQFVAGQTLALADFVRSALGIGGANRSANTIGQTNFTAAAFTVLQRSRPYRNRFRPASPSRQRRQPR